MIRDKITLETANADDPQVDAVVDEEEQTVVTKVAQILNKRMVKGQSSDTEVKYQKYQAIMFNANAMVKCNNEIVTEGDDAMIELSNNTMIQRNNEAVPESDNDATIEHNDKEMIERNNEARTERDNDAMINRYNHGEFDDMVSY